MRRAAADPETWIPREIFAAYCGAKAERLLAYYDRAKSKRQMVTTQLDWFALLLFPAWLGYRRQWALWGALAGCLAVASIVEAIARVHIPHGAFGGMMLALGMMAHGLTLSSAQSIYLKLKGQGLADDAIRAAMANRAAPSAVLAMAALAGMLALGVLGAWLTPEESL
jgi:hypothetical protein